MSTAWSTTDVWILRSLAPNGSTLRGVIGAADYVNHAIPDEAELTGALGRLVAAGLAGFDPAADRFWLTPAGQAADRDTFSTAGLPPVVEGHPATLAPGVYAAAVAAYLG